MSLLSWLVPVALGMGVVGLIAFLWSMKSGQLEDLDGAAERVLLHETDDTPLSDGNRTERADVAKSWSK
ncbi:MAG: cbb3-type cytochrome oxidase assembly protein CcoS [Rhizobiaceae bacterium]|nr:cbb3-type cytochrome oxidase assembly protein CcoS [Rhizobiaceae bacterium]